MARVTKNHKNDTLVHHIDSNAYLFKNAATTDLNHYFMHVILYNNVQSTNASETLLKSLSNSTGGIFWYLYELVTSRVHHVESNANLFENCRDNRLKSLLCTILFFINIFKAHLRGKIFFYFNSIFAYLQLDWFSFC